MRALPELLASPGGRGFLEERGVYVDEETFVAALAPPLDRGLLDAFGLPPSARIPYAGQQAQCDYPHSVTAKFRLLRDLTRHGDDLVPITLPLDTDRPRSNKWITTLRWPDGGDGASVRLIPHRLDEAEMRFIPVDEARRAEVAETVARWLAEWDTANGAGARREGRYDGFLAALRPGKRGTLAETNRAVTSWLLRDGLAFEPPLMLVSELLDTGLLEGPVGQLVEAVDDVIATVNEAIAELVAADVDPKVRPLGPDYLPLWYACPADGKRCRLVREGSGAGLVAVARCRHCGAEHRFSFTGGPALEELAATGRWSPDVTLPIAINRFTSGVVAGQSTALYGLIMNRVVERVLGERPLPMLVPSELARPPTDQVDSLFVQCLTSPT